MNETQRTKVCVSFISLFEGHDYNLPAESRLPGLLNALKGIDVSVSCEAVRYEASPQSRALEHTAGRVFGKVMESLGALLEEVGSRGGGTFVLWVEPLPAEFSELVGLCLVACHVFPLS